MQAETRRVLELWVEKAKLLQSRNFMRTAMDRGSGLTLSLSGEGERVETVGPDDDATDSALLTVRMFKQDNDDLSLRNLAQKWLADPGISKELRDWVNAHRGDLNRHLDSPCMLVVDGVHVTNREILDTFLYGGHGHSDAAKEAQIKRWQELGEPWFPMLEHLFKMTVVDFVGTIINIAYVIQFELAGEPLPPLDSA